MESGRVLVDMPRILGSVLRPRHSVRGTVVTLLASVQRMWHTQRIFLASDATPPPM